MTSQIPTDHKPQVTSRNWRQALWRGMKKHCPACDKGAMFHRYLKVADHCPHCGEELFHQQADDAPPYFTIFIVGHIVIPLVLAVEIAWHPEIWIHMVLWLPLTVVLSLLLLPITKGAVVAIQWAMRMHGFETAERPKTPDMEI